MPSRKKGRPKACPPEPPAQNVDDFSHKTHPHASNEGVDKDVEVVPAPTPAPDADAGGETMMEEEKEEEKKEGKEAEEEVEKEEEKEEEEEELEEELIVCGMDVEKLIAEALDVEEPAAIVPNTGDAADVSLAEKIAALYQDICAEIADISDTPLAEAVAVLHQALKGRISKVCDLEGNEIACNLKLQELRKDIADMQTESRNVGAAKAKLEGTIRELDTVGRKVRKETKTILREEQKRQNELDQKFVLAMNDVNQKMAGENEVCEQLRKDNEDLQGKLTKFTETYKAQQDQFRTRMEARQKETQMLRDRLKEYEERSAASKQNAFQLEKQNKALLKSTNELRERIKRIMGKFDDFNENVNGSNQRHNECKSEIEVLNTKLKALEAENADLRADTQFKAIVLEKETAEKQAAALGRLCENLSKEAERRKVEA